VASRVKSRQLKVYNSLFTENNIVQMMPVMGDTIIQAFFKIFKNFVQQSRRYFGNFFLNISP